MEWGKMATATVSQHFSLSYLADEIGSHIPSVVKIFAEQHGDFVSVWTVVSDFSREVRNSVYDAEAVLMDIHPDMKFDFHVVKANESFQIQNMTVAYVR
jgi:hypothetical protein